VVLGGGDHVRVGFEFFRLSVRRGEGGGTSIFYFSLWVLFVDLRRVVKVKKFLEFRFGVWREEEHRANFFFSACVLFFDLRRIA
jgi:hypothetical protein